MKLNEGETSGQSKKIYKLSKKEIKSIKEIIENLLELWKKSMTERDLKFLGIPLHTVMLAQAFEEEVIKSVKKGEEIILPDRLPLFDLFQKFIDAKLDLLYSKTENAKHTKEDASGNFVAL